MCDNCITGIVFREMLHLQRKNPTLHSAKKSLIECKTLALLKKPAFT